MIKLRDLIIQEGALLDEVFNFSYSTFYNADRWDRWVEFSTDAGEIYKVMVYKMPLGELFNNDAERWLEERGHSHYYEIAFYKDMSNSGGSAYSIYTESTKEFMKVMSTVVNILKKETIGKRPLTFTAKERSRISLYKRMVGSLVGSDDEVRIFDTEDMTLFVIDSKIKEMK